jgi:hypothetical protein
MGFQCLGQTLGSRHQNLVALLERLRALAPHAPVDDRVSRTPFLRGLPTLGPDPTDLGLFLVRESLRRFPAP